MIYLLSSNLHNIFFIDCLLWVTTSRSIEFILFFIDFVDYKLTLSLTSKLTKLLRV